MKFKEIIQIQQFRIKLRSSFKKSSLLELEITLDELKKELERRKTKK